MIRASTFLALLVMASLLAATAAYVAGGRAPPTTPASVAVVKGLPTPMTGLDIPGAWVPKKAMPKDSGTSPLTIADVSAAAALGAVPSPGVVEPPTASVESLFERAAHLEQIGQHEEAISTLKSIAKMTPGDGKVWMKLMNAHKRRGQLELAERAVAAGIDANPSNARLQQARADICRTQKRFPEAAKHFRRAMELDESLASVYDSWGRMEVRPRAPPEPPRRPAPPRALGGSEMQNDPRPPAFFRRRSSATPPRRRRSSRRGSRSSRRRASTTPSASSRTAAARPTPRAPRSAPASPCPARTPTPSCSTRWGWRRCAPGSRRGRARTGGQRSTRPPPSRWRTSRWASSRNGWEMRRCVTQRSTPARLGGIP